MMKENGKGNNCAVPRVSPGTFTLVQFADS